MVGIEQASSRRATSRAALGRDPRLLRRRRPRRSHLRIVLGSALLGALFLGASSSTIDFQDVATLFGKDLPLSQRWLAHLVPTPSGEIYVPSLVAPDRRSMTLAAGDGIIVEPKLDLVHTGTVVSAPEFVPPRVNRDGKQDVAVSRHPVVRLRFSAGVLAAANADDLFAAEASQAVAMVMPNDAPKQIIAAATPEPPKVAKPSVTLASVAPMGKSAKRDGGADDMVQAYANTDDSDQLEAPFKAVLNKPMAIGIDGKPDHWWVTNPIPPVARSATEQKCLATAIYFEARGEPVKGELAVAQVVINRLKNPAYPKTICGVVYQNKNMRNACQFSFACDGIKDRITDFGSWQRAQELARRVIFQDNWWNAEVGSSTHYHANYVRPRWARSMKKMERIGHHIFYKTFGGGWS